jgi:diaminopimelate epimerase
MKIWHMSGAGNDFMVMDARGGSYDFSELALKLCAMTGADGFMAVDYSDVADFRLHFYNSDGSRGEMCGNGSRCICRFAYENGIAGETMTVQTDAGIVPGRRLSEDMYRVKLNNPGILDLHRKGDAAYVELGVPGVPHGVIRRQGLRWEDAEAMRQESRALRYDPAFPKGANINFYTHTAPGEVLVLTYERGVEDYALACGTGCGSIACVLWTKGELPDGKLTAHCKGGTLRLTVSGADGIVDELYLEGPTETLKIHDLYPPHRTPCLPCRGGVTAKAVTEGCKPPQNTPVILSERSKSKDLLSFYRDPSSVLRPPQDDTVGADAHIGPRAADSRPYIPTAPQNAKFQMPNAKFQIINCS